MTERAGLWTEALGRAMGAFAEDVRDYPRLLESIVRCTAQVCEGFCAVSLVSSDGAWLERVAFYDEDPEARELLTPLATRVATNSEALAAQVVRSGQSKIVPQVTTQMVQARFPEPSWAAVEALAIRGVMVVPLRHGSSILGTLVINRHGPNAAAFEEADIELANYVANHAAQAIANARHFDDAQQLNVRLGALSSAAREFAAVTSDLPALLAAIARLVGEEFGELCTVSQVSQDGAWLEPAVGVHHTNLGLLEAALQYARAQRARLGEGIAGRVALTGQALFLPQLAEAGHPWPLPIPVREPALERPPISSVIALPLTANERTVGVVLLGRSALLPPYTQADLRLAQDLVAYASLAVSNARLLETARRELVDRERAEAALAATEEQLRQAQKMDAIGRLAGGIAHDFNNLLSVILSYTDLLLEAPALGQEEDLKQIKRAGERAAELTIQLLAFSRQHVLAPRIVDLGALIAQICPMIERLIGEDIRLQTVLAKDLGQVKADPGHLEQVLLNLVVNARDAMPRGGTLTLETEDVELAPDYARTHLGVNPGPHVMFAVSDTGSGMDRLTQERIFEPFFTTKEVGKGTGLGLSTAFGIVKQSGGTIWVYSELGKGTTFKVYLPRSFEQATVTRPSVPVEHARGTETVLLVEDEEQVRIVARSILMRHGYEVLDAANGDEALQVSRTYAGIIHLLLTDVVMPGIDGGRLAKQLLEQRPALRVLFSSGYTGNAIIHHQVLGDDIDLLQKPFTPDSLLTRVREILER